MTCRFDSETNRRILFTMNKLVKGGIVIAVLMALSSLQGCFGLQRAVGCSNPGVLGCRDKISEASESTQAPSDVEHAPSRSTQVGDGRYLDGHEYPWSRILDECMAAGGTRTECFATLPSDILEQFEAWEAERAAQRRGQIDQESRHPSFGVESVNPSIKD